VLPAIDLRIARRFGRKIRGGEKVGFDGAAGGTFARAERLDHRVLSQQPQQLKTIGETHVPHIIAGLGEIL
jgi:hypothetical protein